MARRDVIVPTAEDMDFLIGECKPNATGERNRALLEVLRWSGLRISEALALEPRDVEEDGEGNVRLHVRHGKGDKARRATLIDFAVPTLQAWLQAHEERGLPDTAPVFCVLNGKRAGAPLTRAYVDAMLKRLAVDAGLPSWKRVHAHAFRAAHATWLYRNRAPLAEIQQQLGHSHAVTTQAYLAKIDATELATNLNRLAKLSRDAEVA